MSTHQGGEPTTSGLALVRNRATPSAVAYPLRSPTTTIGSGAAADIRLLSPHVSGVHCEVTVTGGTASVKDDGSTAGTRVGSAEVPLRVATPLPIGSDLTVGDVTLTLEPHEEPAAEPPEEREGVSETIAGASALRGVLLYGATLLFAGLFAYFIYEIVGAPADHPPKFEGPLVPVAAALAGVLGSGFALAIGVPVAKVEVNEGLAQHLAKAAEEEASPTAARIHQALSIAPASQSSVSWPITAGVWMYGLVGVATFVAYLINQDQTPEPIKTLAIAFAGYVVALATAAYSGRGSGS
jgi:FHA domain